MPSISISRCPRPTCAMKRGDALFMHKLTVHASHSNQSDNIRWSFDLRYNPIGQPTGRDSFPGFIARSRQNPETELRDPAEWARRWLRQIVAQLAADLGRAQLSQRLGLDLACALAGHPDRLADLFQRAVPAVQQPIAQTQDLAFTLGESVERGRQILAQQQLARHLDRCFLCFVLDELPQGVLPILSNWGRQRDRLPQRFQHAGDLLDRLAKRQCQLLTGRLPPQRLSEPIDRALELPDRLAHMY